jgi:hypothetical protein
MDHGPWTIVGATQTNGGFQAAGAKQWLEVSRYRVARAMQDRGSSTCVLVWERCGEGGKSTSSLHAAGAASSPLFGPGRSDRALNLRRRGLLVVADLVIAQRWCFYQFHDCFMGIRRIAVVQDARSDSGAAVFGLVTTSAIPLDFRRRRSRLAETASPAQIPICCDIERLEVPETSLLTQSLSGSHEEGSSQCCESRPSRRRGGLHRNASQRRIMSVRIPYLNGLSFRQKERDIDYLLNGLDGEIWTTISCGPVNPF